MMVSFRLNDAELIGKIEAVPKQMRSTIYREALRKYFGGASDVIHVIPQPALKIELSADETKKGAVNIDDNLDKLLGGF